MQYSLTGNDSRIGKYAALMTDAVLRPNVKELIEEIKPISIPVHDLSFHTKNKSLENSTTTLNIKSCDPLMPADIIVQNLTTIKDISSLELHSYIANEDHLYIPNSKFIHWVNDRLIITSVGNSESFIHVYSYPELKKCYSVYFENEIIVIDSFKHVQFDNITTVMAIIFKDALQVTLYGLPLHSRSDVIVMDPLMDLNIYPQEYPTCVDCKLNHIAIGYLNGDVAVFKISKVPQENPMPFFHKFVHTSLVSQVCLPIYLGNFNAFQFVISSGLNGKIIYSEFSIKQSHGGVAISTAATISKFSYLPFIDGVLFCDFDDSIKYATFFSRTEMRRLATIRGGVSSYGCSNIHPFLAVGGYCGSLTIFNSNHSRVKHGKTYVYTYSLIKKNNNGDKELYLMNASKLPKDAPPTLRTDGSVVHIEQADKINAICWSPLMDNSNKLAQLGNEIVSLLEL